MLGEAADWFFCRLAVVCYVFEQHPRPPPLQLIDSPSAISFPMLGEAADWFWGRSHVLSLTHGARLFEPSAQGPREGIAAEPRQRKKYFALPSGTEH